MSLNFSNPALAINGGTPARTLPWLDNFTTGDEEKCAVHRVLDSGYLSLYEGSNNPDPPFSFLGGPEVQSLESEWSDFYRVNHSVAFNSATSCLYASIGALGIGYGDEVIVSPYTMSACALAPLIYGAIPVFADVDPRTGCLDPTSVASRISSRTKAILVVHQFGFPADMDALLEIALPHNIKIIEDCAQAHGAMYKGKSAGSIGHIGAWSFCQDKIMTTGGEGGMVTTNDETLWKKMWSYKDHGKNYDSVYNKQHPPGFRWLHDSFGTNWRMMEIQAVIGRIQLKKMPEWTAVRNSNMARIQAAFENSPYFTVAKPSADYVHAAYKCYVQVNVDALPEGWSRDHIMAEINALGVPCFSGSCSEVYLEKAFDGTPWRPEQRLKHAQQLGESSLIFVVHPTLSQQSLQKTVDAIQQVIARIS